MSTKLAIMGASDFQNPIILKAKEMGLETHAFAWECGDIGEKTADVFHPVSIADKEKILEICQKEQISGITTCGSDFAVVAINYVAEKMGLPGNPTSTTLQCTNKFAMREALKRGGVPVPRFLKVSKDDCCEKELSEMKFPLIVKPTDRSGSRAIQKVTNAEDLKTAIKNAVEVSFKKEAIVEEYIDGPEYSCESVTKDGVHQTIAITKKYTSGAPYFIEIGHMQPSDIKKELYPSVVAQIHKALTALGIRNSASHAEFRLQPDGTVQFMEIGARMGGGCIGSDLTMLSTGIDFLRATIQVAIGEEPDLTPAHPEQIAKIKFFLTPEDIKNFENIKGSLNLVRATIFKPETVEFVPGVPTRIGYYIFTEKLQ